MNKKILFFAFFALFLNCIDAKNDPVANETEIINELIKIYEATDYQRKKALEYGKISLDKMKNTSQGSIFYDAMNDWRTCMYSDKLSCSDEEKAVNATHNSLKTTAEYIEFTQAEDVYIYLDVLQNQLKTLCNRYQGTGQEEMHKLIDKYSPSNYTYFKYEREKPFFENDVIIYERKKMKAAIDSAVVRADKELHELIDELWEKHTKKN